MTLRSADQRGRSDLAEELEVAQVILRFRSQARPYAGEQRGIGVSAGVGVVVALERPSHILTDARELEAAEDSQLKRARGAEGMPCIQCNGIIGKTHAALTHLIRVRAWADQKRGPRHLGGAANERVMGIRVE